MITIDDVKLAFLQVMEGGNWAAANLEGCPWPKHVHDSIMQHSQQALLIGVFKGLITYKCNTFDLDIGKVGDAGPLIDDMWFSFMKVYADELSGYDGDTSGRELKRALNKTFGLAFTRKEADITVKLTEINSIIFG